MTTACSASRIIAVAAAAVLAAAGSAGAADASPPWVGTWSASTLWCAPGQRGGVPPIRITPTGHRRGDNTCRYTHVERVDGQTWRIEATCVDGKYRSHERFVFEMLRDNLAITYPDRGGATVVEMRCP